MTSIMISIAAAIWGLVYILYDEFVSGWIPLSYSIVTVLSLIILRIFNIYRLFSFTQIFLFLLLPFLLMISLGGYVSGGAVIIWGLFAPLAALLSGQLRQSYYWYAVYALLLITSGLVQPYLRTANNIPVNIQTMFFVFNLGVVAFIIFQVLHFFVKKKDNVIEIMKKNRELEQAYLKQEFMLRQSEKLATLGRLSAGMAHELNNPATAALRGSKQLMDSVQKLQSAQFNLGQLQLGGEQREIFKAFKSKLYERAKQPADLDALDRSDSEEILANWLRRHNIDESWEMAAMLAGLDVKIDELENLEKKFNPDQFPVVVSALCQIYITQNLLEEINEGTGRITELVKSLKSYSHMDKAPLQLIDIHTGLNDTLVMLRSQLKKGVTVQRNYGANLPQIEAYPGELNQVWTNIIDNAIYAMKGNGRIQIKTFTENNWIVVQIIDNGPGIPEKIQSKIFDPFFTTKAPGEGSGLGLSICYNIIVEKHKGKINLYTKSGETCFEIKIPMKNEIKES